MSQHHFPAQTSSGRAVEVMIGYDRPLHGFFLVVCAAELETAAMADAIDAGDDEAFHAEGVVYSNLDDVDLYDLRGLTLDLGYFKGKLDRLGISLPASIETELHEDLRLRIGNKERFYDAGGVLQMGREG